MKKHKIVPIFIPHEGCPNQCVFCNQRAISGHGDFDINAVRGEIEAGIASIDPSCVIEIAYFGGSFTGIQREKMTALLQLAQEYVDSGRVCSIRFSTRPDYINHEIIGVLSKYTIRTIELGMQSFDGEVLVKSKRGHSRDDIVNAIGLLRENGYDVVGQMMLGLPSSSRDKEIQTATEIAQLGCSGTRIYPVLVFKDTELKDMCTCGEYTPITLEEAIETTKEIVRILRQRKVDIIKLGLHASEDFYFNDILYAGPYHEAFGELVEGELIYDKLCKIIEKSGKKDIVVRTKPSDVSKTIGHGKYNKVRLMEKFSLNSMKVIADINADDISIL